MELMDVVKSGDRHLKRCFHLAGGHLLLFMVLLLLHPGLYSQSLNSQNDPYVLAYQMESTGRIKYGAERLAETFRKVGYRINLIGFRQSESPVTPQAGRVIYIGTSRTKFLKTLIALQKTNLRPDTVKEGFSLLGCKDGKLVIAGADASGALYGCLELRDRILHLASESETATGKRLSLNSLMDTLHCSDQPQMVLRGACIGLQKTFLLPGRGTYEYPITRENFPWFYNKELWIKYLDMLVDNRMNTLYLWSGHPFASLVRLKEYPDAVEVDSATFAANQHMFAFLTKEANKRGIWVIQAFYNIIVSKPFAEKHHIKTQDRNRPILPLIADYTRKSIAAFVRQYPNVGLLVTLGEAMEGVGPDDTEWFTKTIIPGVKDGLSALGETQEPPIILRAHDADAPAVIAAAKPLYGNLYTMAKYNGEALTTYQPRGSWAELHRTLSDIAPVQVENVHILANLEPFRYGADDFIQKCVQAMHKIYGSNGLHLYPQASYWDWPYSADKTDPRLLQINRDWIWYSQWARYSWNADRDRASERKYWAGQLAGKYGSSLETGSEILKAYEASGEIAPKLLRRYGITDGNRQTLSLGMTMSQLIDPERYGLFTLLYTSESPEGEMITQYAKRDWLHEKHIGETPVQVAGEVVQKGKEAVSAIEAASGGVTKNLDEFNRLKADMYSYQYLASFYSNKALAALKILRYGYSHDISDLEKAVPLMTASVEAFRRLAQVAGAHYLYANSLQTGARKIPMTGKDGQYKRWSELLPVYEGELTHLKQNIQSLKYHKDAKSATGSPWHHLRPASVHFLAPSVADRLDGNGLGSYYIQQGSKDMAGTYPLMKSARPFADTTAGFDSMAVALTGLHGIQVNRNRQVQAGTRLRFKTDQPVTLFVGYFIQKSKVLLKEPELETDASANDYGQAATKIANGAALGGYPAINIHTYTFDKGIHDLQLGKGICLLLGFAKGSADDLPAFDAGIGNAGSAPDLDWLFR